MVAIALAGSSLILGQTPGAPEFKVMAEPALPFFDWGVCPFETCMYRQWTARDAITVYDTWKPERRPIATLSAGETVTGVTGVVITNRAGVVRMDRDLPERNLKRGDILLTYAYRGEGYWAAWLNGRLYGEFDLTFAKLPDGTGCGGAHCAATFVDRGDYRWWAQVRAKSGATGWVDMDHGVLGGFEF